MRDIFERAILENPDDVAGYAAYADWLRRQGDPQGEFIQVQLALEDEGLPSGRRKELRTREGELFAEHKAEWVGEWAAHPAVAARTYLEWQPVVGWAPFRFSRGLLTAVEVGELTVDLARQMVRAPQLRLVRELTVRGIAYEPPDECKPGHHLHPRRDLPAQYVLLQWPQLRHLRVFRFGDCEPRDYDTDYCPYICHTPGDLVADFAERMLDVEELYIMAHFRDEADRLASLPMPRLQVLLLYHGWGYPLDRLAENPSLTNLKELYCHPHALEDGDEPYIRLPHLRAVCRSPHLANLTHLQLRLADCGDDGVNEMVQSGILRRLKRLDLRHGRVTDRGARALAECPEARGLEHLDLSHNAVTATGLYALKAVGINAIAGHPLPAERLEAGEYLWNGDIE